MTDMPDFDSMSPEEMMKWMESLAVRQGATEGLTTEADMDVAEVAEDDERLAGKGDYVPYGWTADKWKEHLAQEEAAKKAKQAVAPPPPPTPEPEPEPVASAAPASGEPDFDSMSPEELMKWMESLAVRQGATEGLTTEADMSIAEVDANDARLEGKGDYVPYGWKEDKWKEHLAQEEAAKKAKQAAPQPEPAAETVDEELEEALAGDVLAAPSLDDLFGGGNIIGDDDDDSEEETVAAALPSFDDLFGGATDNEIPDLDLSALEGLGSGDATDNPMDWLAGLAGADETPALDMDALGSLAALGGNDEEEAVASPMDWLSGLAEGDSDFDTDDDEESEEGSLEWLETLAKQEGANSEELVTSANLDIPMPDFLEDTGPGYEEFSFEQGSGMIIEDDEDDEIMPAFEIDDIDMTDPENWLDSLAQAQSGTGPLVGLGDDIDDDDDISDEIPTFDDVSTDIRDKINSGDVSPEEIALLFGTAFDAAGKRKDVPDYIDSDDDFDDEEIEAPVQAEIPDWLQEQMTSVPEDAEVTNIKKTDTAEMMMMNLGFEAEAETVDELPDWLTSDSQDDTGDIAVDIFDDMFAEAEEEEPIKSERATQEVQIAETDDTWVIAFTQEASGELPVWYENRLAEIDGETSAKAAAVTLQVADLPLETTLSHGEAMALPAWLSGDAEPVAPVRTSVEASAVEDVDMDWLSADETEVLEADMPDWLLEQVDDDIAPAEELPSWLASDDIDIESVEDIPDWLRETMDEEEEAVPEIDFSLDEEPAVAPEPVAPPVAKVEKPVTAPVPVQKSPAPVPKVAAAVDVSSALQSAQEKVSAGDIDGAMLDFESVVRANQALDMVEKALSKITSVDAHKRNPVVHRVLGDVLMRQGKLQQALDTYRRALNML